MLLDRLRIESRAMRCRIRRRRNVVAFVSGSLVLIVIVSVTYIPVYIQLAALVQSVNFSASTDVQTGFQHATTQPFGKYFVTCSINVICQYLLQFLATYNLFTHSK